MIFKEIHFSDGKKKFMMGSSKDLLKEVTEETYEKLSQDDYSYISRNINIPIKNNETYNAQESEFVYYEDTFDMVSHLQSVNPEEAVEILDNILFSVMDDAFLQGCIDTYNSMGEIMYKLAIQLEDQLESVFCDD